jgi:hypothetical protein
MKTFSLEDAQALLPVVEALLDRAVAARDQAARLEDKMAMLKVRIFHSGGLSVDVAAVYRDASELTRHREAATEVMEEFASIGVQIKDLDKGLLDFPCLLDGEVVLLCWQRGETQIEYWHTLDSGFAGRQKLDARFRKGSRADRLN